MPRSEALFGDDLDPDDLFSDRQTGSIMEFDVNVQLSGVPDNFNPGNLPGYGGAGIEDSVRRVALFEGTEEFGRLQPLLDTIGKQTSN